MYSSTDAVFMRRIQNIAAEIRQTVNQKKKSLPPVLPSSITPPPLDLQPSSYLQSVLSDPTLPTQATAALSRNVALLIKEYECQYILAAQKLWNVPPSENNPADKRLQYLRSAFQARFRAKAERTILLPLEGFMRRDPEGSEGRPKFNHECTPILEDSFRTNPYPTKAVRSRLAQETQMSVKQIEVWFQNHRNRSRKDGHVLRKVDSPVRKSPAPTRAGVTDETRPRSTTPCSITSTEIPKPSIAEAPSRIPSPSMFSLTDVNRPKFPAPTWLRHTSSSSQGKRPNLDMDDLALQFATKLSLKERKLKSRRSWSSEPESPSAVPARSSPLPLLKAPLPSLLTTRTRPYNPPKPWQRIRSTRARRCPNTCFQPYARPRAGNPFFLENAENLFSNAHPSPCSPLPQCRISSDGDGPLRLAQKDLVLSKSSSRRFHLPYPSPKLTPRPGLDSFSIPAPIISSLA
ncbi:hypothetical protein BDN72DRAFT_39572 [Pluteus cervinus]|uniref:Uncharacterized protein n=1 Tax=Pluteus cervinus TaxID=181527 RepID=A0ACD3BJH4_9AGAR|nr:hypothetical protein BDN72DRAFT_39572 [Pluteus cervinus]